MLTQSIGNTIAPLQNVALCSQAITRSLTRGESLPGIVVLYGPSGWGKTFAATWSANKYRAYYVQCKSAWTRKAFLKAILMEMGISPAATIYEMVDQISQEVALSSRPLIIDEADFLVEKKIIEIVRDIYESSFGTILLIGEEHLPAKLKRWERFHNRVLAWVQAQPSSLEDARTLANIYAPDVKVHDDLLISLVEASRNVTRRICVNLNHINDTAKQNGWAEIDMSMWGKKELYTGQAAIRNGISG
ncbi:MAG: ATP-binding protein [Gammaproteobacteria bacterium]|nr:ATP-binding protein [Gammaproteobacteria bacterium]